MSFFFAWGKRTEESFVEGCELAKRILLYADRHLTQFKLHVLFCLFYYIYISEKVQVSLEILLGFTSTKKRQQELILIRSFGVIQETRRFMGI